MASETTLELLKRGLALSAKEIQLLTGWADEMVEDYLSLFNSLVTLAQTIDLGAVSTNRTVTRVSTSPYEILDSDNDVFFDTTAGDIVATLRPGIQDVNHRLVNVGTGNNKVSVTPFGTEKLLAVNGTKYLYDEETLTITFDALYGWH